MCLLTINNCNCIHFAQWIFLLFESLWRKERITSVQLLVILLTFKTKGIAHKTSGNLYKKSLDCPYKIFCLWFSFYIHVRSQAHLCILKISKENKIFASFTRPLTFASSTASKTFLHLENLVPLYNSFWISTIRG